jgi:hypothetical protein
VPAERKPRNALKAVVYAGARPIRCEVCGEELFRGLPIPWRGGIKLLGAERALVRVDWSSMNQLVFRHVETERCAPAPKAS